MCRDTLEGGRRCPGKRRKPKPNSRKATTTASSMKSTARPGLKAPKATKVKKAPKPVKPPIQSPPQEDLDIDAAMEATIAQAEAEAVEYQAWLDALETPLERELAQIGLAGLNERYGFDHSGFQARFMRLDELADLEIPGMGAVPTLPSKAGELGALVIKPSALGKTWHPMSGLTLTWRGEGDSDERERFHLLIGSWLSGVFASLRHRHEGARRDG